MPLLFDTFTGGLVRLAGVPPQARVTADETRAARRDRTAADAADILRRLATGRRAGLVLRASLMTVAGGALVGGALAGAGAFLAARHAEATAAISAPPPQAWVDVIRPMPIYDLGGTDFAKLPRTYQARRHVPDGTREDVMSFGTPGDGKPYLRIALTRVAEADPREAASASCQAEQEGAGGATPSCSEPHGGGTSEPPATVADALARVAATAADTATQFRALPSIETRFGALERADFTLWRDGTAFACHGFRGLPSGGHVLRLTGFACGSADRPLDANAVACVADRIDLLSAGDDRPLRALFVAAQQRPGAASCGEGVLAARLVPALASGPYAALRRRAAWLEAGSEGPPLRGALDASDDAR